MQCNIWLPKRVPRISVFFHPIPLIPPSGRNKSPCKKVESINRLCFHGTWDGKKKERLTPLRQPAEGCLWSMRGACALLAGTPHRPNLPGHICFSRHCPHQTHKKWLFFSPEFSSGEQRIPKRTIARIRSSRFPPFNSGLYTTREVKLCQPGVVSCVSELGPATFFGNPDVGCADIWSPRGGLPKIPFWRDCLADEHTV